MSEETTIMGSELVAELNDLLQLDHDAVAAYSLAIGRLQNDVYREALAGFRDEHQRHIRELTALIEERGATPVQLPHLTGPFKVAMQALGAMGDDRAVLLAFKTNEGQVRDKYARHAARKHPAAVQDVIERAAADEEKHYMWTEQALRALGAGPETLVGRVEQAVETAQGRVSDAAEAAGRRVTEALDRARPDRGG